MIEQYYRGFFEGPIKITEFTFPHLETGASGEIGYATGSYKQRLAPKSGATIEDSGSFVVIVKRDAGVWKAAYLIYNSDRPSAPPDAALAVISPLPALRNYYAAVAYEWVVWFGFLVLGSACIGIIASLIRAVRLSSRPGTSMSTELM